MVPTPSQPLLAPTPTAQHNTSHSHTLAQSCNSWKRYHVLGLHPGAIQPQMPHFATGKTWPHCPLHGWPSSRRRPLQLDCCMMVQPHCLLQGSHTVGQRHNTEPGGVVCVCVPSPMFVRIRSHSSLSHTQSLSLICYPPSLLFPPRVLTRANQRQKRVVRRRTTRPCPPLPHPLRRYWWPLYK